MDRWEPKIRSRQAGLLLQILKFSFHGDPLTRLEAFEREISEYSKLQPQGITDLALAETHGIKHELGQEARKGDKQHKTKAPRASATPLPRVAAQPKAAPRNRGHH